ncbi:MAG: hypothetical protein ACM3ZC_06285 [Bacteroidota bacterium]
MNERPVVVLYGDSMRLASLELSLRLESSLDVVRYDSITASDDELRPDLVLFDLDADDALNVFTHFQNGSGRPILVGLGLADRRAVLFAGQPRMVGTVTDLGGIIGDKTPVYH